MRALPCALVLALTAARVAPAFAAALHQPDGTAIPVPMGCDSGHPTGLAAAFACVCDPSGACNIGAPCPAPGQCVEPTGSCETTLWHDFNDNTCIPSNIGGLDPYTDGSLSPETFEPTCPLTFTLVTRGTARFHDIFGWYNVTGQRPSNDQLFPMLDCSTTAGAVVSLDVRSDPRWTGGAIGFFIATPEQHDATGTCAGGDCCASVSRLSDTVGRVFYSQRELNPDSAGADSLIHLIVYNSVLADRKFYFAWEDIFGGSNNDFTDLVTSVGGVECTGGGTACNTGMPGLCQYGVSECRGESVECVQVYDAIPEICNGADDDCDGLIDEGGVCNDDVGSSCANVVCPGGQICKAGQCVDPCDNVSCPQGMACLSGICLAGCNQCNGVVCGDGTSCDLNSGSCLGPGGATPDAGPGSGSGSDPGGGPSATGCCDTSGRGGPLGPAVLGAFLLLAARRRRLR